MSTSDLQPSPHVCLPRDAALVSLATLLGVEVRVATLERSRRQSSAADSLWAPAPALDASHSESSLARRAYDTRVPQFGESHGDLLTVAVPFVDAQHAHRVAIAQIDSGNRHVVERMVALWHEHHQATRRIAALECENQQLAARVTSDVEELAFLQSIVEDLDVRDKRGDWMVLADRILPHLCQRIGASGLCMMRGDDDTLLGIPEAWYGTSQVADATCMNLLQWFGDAALRQPVVKNRLAHSPEGALLRGVNEFVLVPVVANDQQLGWLLAINKWSRAAGAVAEFGSHEASLLAATANVMAGHVSNLQHYREKEQLIVGVVRALVSAIEAKDDYTCGHSERVALFAQCLARQVGYDDASCERMYLTGLVHDLGKIGVADAVLKKPDRLTDLEYAEIKRHPVEGWAILHELQALAYVLPGMLYHHERYDGQGYPDGLRGEAIPMDGRLLAIVDAYDAMTSDRHYRPGMPVEKAQSMLREGSGTQWDPQLVDAFFRVLPQIEQIRTSYVAKVRPQRRRTLVSGGCQMHGTTRHEAVKQL